MSGTRGTTAQKCHPHVQPDTYPALRPICLSLSLPFFQMNMWFENRNWGHLMETNQSGSSSSVMFGSVEEALAEVADLIREEDEIAAAKPPSGILTELMVLFCVDWRTFDCSCDSCGLGNERGSRVKSSTDRHFSSGDRLSRAPPSGPILLLFACF